MSTPASYEDTVAWLAGHAAALDSEEVPAHAADGRVLAAPVTASGDCPPSATASVDGFAVKADATVGASDYNPLVFSVRESGTSGDGVVAVASGEVLPGGADAVIPVWEVEARGGSIDVHTPVAAGENVVPAAREAAKGDRVLETGRILRPADVALLVALGRGAVPVVRRPGVGILPVRSGVPGASGAMVQSLVKRDGGDGWFLESSGTPLPEIMAGDIGNLLLVIGGSGPGANDASAAALETAGEVVFRGVAINPGDTVTIGRVGGKVVVLLPGPPLAALFAYDALAGRAIRRLGGRPAEWPYAARRVVLGRKIASRLGLLECCRVRLSGEVAEPVAVFDNRTLSTAVRADGFVLVPASSEGFAEGDPVSVYLYEQRF